MSKFKLGIIIPLKAIKVAENWSVVESALLRVLSSINNQTADNFECVVVGHNEPLSYSIDAECKNTKFVTFDEFEPPSKEDFEGMELQLKYEFDRCSKIAKGMNYLNSNDISHWFALDADDLLHSSFVHTISQLEDSDAIVIDNGYFYFENRNIVNKAEDFSLYCGSSCIIKAGLTLIPKHIDHQAYKQVFYGAVPHMNVKEYFLSKKLSYVVPEERLIMYVRDNGENISNFYFANWYPRVKKWIKLHIKALRFSRKQFKDFGFKENDDRK